MSTVLPPVTGGIMADIINWVRRIIKSPSAQAISNAIIGDYVNRFITYDLAERIQLLELRRQYTFETIPNIFQYQAPYTQDTTNNWPGNPTPPPFNNNPSPPQNQTIIPIYQNFLPPMYADGIQMGYYQSHEQFYKIFPELVLNEFPVQGQGTGIASIYNLNIGKSPVLRGFIDDLGNLLPYVFITAQGQNGGLQYVVDSGYVDTNGLGILVQTDETFQNIIGPNLVGTPPSSGGSGLINYLTGEITNLSFISIIPTTVFIEVQTTPYSAGFPRCCLFYNNIFKLYPVPDRAYKIQIDAYVTPSVFFNTQNSVAFAYMSEFIARGTAQKILSDNGDWEQFDRYEPLFRQQENFVLRRSDRQRAVIRTPTIFSSQTSTNAWIYTQY